jgi:hypothetical protein
MSASSFVRSPPTMQLSCPGYHWWQDLDLWLWPSDKATILPMEKIKTHQGQKIQDKLCAHFHRHQGDCSQIICLGRLNSQFHIVLWHLMASVWICVKTFPQTLATKTSRCIMTMHNSSPENLFTKNNMTAAHNHYTHLVWSLATCLCFPSSSYSHFDTTEMIKVELQAVLNTLTEYDFRMHLKKWQKCWQWCICMEGDFKVEGSLQHQSHKVCIRMRLCEA